MAGVFAGLATMVAAELDDRRGGDLPALWLSLTAPIEPTAPAEAVKDDIGSLMAWAIAVSDQRETRGATRLLWRGVIAELARNRDRLRALGIAL